MNNTESLSFTVTLASDAHRLAKKFCYQHRDAHKVKQVYLNTLTVYAVNYYCQCLGIDSNWEASDSWNPALQALMNVADLQVEYCGTLECCPIVSDEQVDRIFPEVQEDRIGFVLVQLNEALTEAMLLGFSPTIENGVLLVNQLRSLDDLADYLSHAIESQPSVNLRNWFQNVFERGWQTLESLLATNSLVLSPAYRSDDEPDAANASQAAESIKGAKFIYLGDTSSDTEAEGSKGCTVEFLVFLAPQHDDRTRVTLQVHPTAHHSYLPEGLKLQILSEAGEILQEVEAGSTNDYIQKQLIASEGERFGARIVLGEISWIENFVI
ncbi:MAG: DUF1822 family protein [Stenomitos frigidus ULC029]